MRTEKKRTTKKKIGNEEKQKIESEIFNNNKNKKTLKLFTENWMTISLRERRRRKD